MFSAPAMAIFDQLARIGIYVIAGENASTKDEMPRATKSLHPII
jgi:hypothetical protein